MNLKQLLHSKKLCVVVVAIATTMMMVSCAGDGFDDESYGSSVKNTQLSSPSENDINVTASADGSMTIISWPVVRGAGGYHAILTNTTTNEIEVDTIIDGVSFAAKRAEDTNYSISVLTLGNRNLGNTEASTPTVKTFTTFTPAYATIPNGSDLYQYFQENTIPEVDDNGDGVADEVYYDLEPNGNYTVSNILDFNAHSVTLRTSDKLARATVTYGEGASITYCAGLGLKYIKFDVSASTNPVFAFSSNPTIEADVNHNNYHQITTPTIISSCDFEGVQSYFLYDNKIKYCLKTFMMNDCRVHLTLSTTTVSSNAIFQIYDGQGFINDITFKNSTIWNTGEKDCKYFIRYHNSCRCDRAGYATNSINYINCTLYNIAKTGQMGNYSGFDGRATSNYNVENCIFVDCGNAQVARRIVARLGTGAIAFNNNTYEFNGELNDQSGYDTGNILTTAPGLADPLNGNLTPSGAEQVSMKTGDPYWYK